MRTLGGALSIAPPFSLVIRRGLFADTKRRGANQMLAVRSTQSVIPAAISILAQRCFREQDSRFSSASVLSSEWIALCPAYRHKGILLDHLPGACHGSWRIANESAEKQPPLNSRA